MVRRMGAFLVGGVVLVVGACDRAPPEPIVATAEAKPKPQRCVRPLREPPPPPASSAPDPSCPKDPASPPKVPIATLRFPEAKDAVALETEIMSTEEQRNRGLMYRTDMAETHGMIFAFAGDDKHEFWMRNTCLSLDMMFVGQDGFIAGILENVPTMTDDPRTVPCAVRYVLETRAGFARRHGVKPGQKIDLSGLPALTPE